MRFHIFLTIALVLVSSTLTQGFLRRIGTGIVNKVLGKDCITDLPAGKLGTQIAQTLIKVPGAKNLMERTLCAFGKHVNAIQEDLENIMAERIDLKNIPPSIAPQVQSALNSIKNAAKPLLNAIQNVIPNLARLDNIQNLQSAMTDELKSAGSNLSTGVTELVRSVGNNLAELPNVLNTVMPKTIESIPELAKAVLRDLIGAPIALGKMAIKPFLPSYVAWFL